MRKIWTFLSEINRTDQIILGVERSVPSVSQVSPILDRDGSTQLFPEFPGSQWRSLCSWATAALKSSLRETLLVKNNVGALFDTLIIFEGGEIDPCKLILNLEYGLADRYFLIFIYSLKIYWAPKATPYIVELI